jgi:hypothetical protein
VVLAPTPGASQSGYEFSLSASATDPSQHTSTPTGGVRNIYLWATCIEDGLSAFEGDVTGSLTVIGGFNPATGVLNAGGATNLLLAVGGCPYGTEVNLLLGYLVVYDTGGTLCLGPSAAHGLIGCVDCQQPAPSVTPDPIVVGFASGGSPPCSTGVAGCPGGESRTFGSFGT